MDLTNETALAYAAFAAGRHAEAEHRVGRVLDLVPRDPGASTLLGRLALAGGDPERGRAVFADLVREHPRVAAVWLDLALALRDLGRAREAVESAARAVRLDKENVSAWLVLGEGHLSLDQRGKAARAFRRALALAPDNGAAYRGLVRAEPPQAGSTLMSRMQDLADSGRLAGRGAAELHYALAHAHRQLGDDQRFIQHLLEANACQRALSSEDEAAYDVTFDRLEQTFTRQAMARCSRARTVEPTPIFVLGMPRSGTTLVERLLAGHPEVAGGGELDYVRGPLRRDWVRRLDRVLPEGFDDLSCETFTELAQDFAGRLALVDPKARFVVDKTPGNYHVLGLLRALFPDGRIVHVERDPMDTCFSILQHPFDDRSPHMCDQRLLAHVYGRYRRMMAHWREVLGDEFLTVSYERLVESPEAEGRRLFEHCGLIWRDDYLDFHGRGDVVRTFSAAQVRRPIYRSSIGAWRPFAASLSPLREGLERALGSNMHRDGVHE